MQEIPADKYTELHIGFEVREPLGETWTSQFVRTHFLSMRLPTESMYDDSHDLIFTRCLVLPQVNRILLACIDNARPHDASRAHMSFGKYRIMSKMASSSA